MKYAFFGDIHTEDLSSLEKKLDSINPDVLGFLGDIDTTQVAIQLKNLEIKYLNQGKKFIKIPGNHDNAIYNNFKIDYSESLEKLNKSIWQLHLEFMSNPEAGNYLRNLVNSEHQVKIFLDENKFQKNYQTILVHGAYDGNLSKTFEAPREITASDFDGIDRASENRNNEFINSKEKLKDLWARLKSPEDYEKNFKIMSEKGDRVMIRGHDHFARWVFKNEKGEITGYHLTDEKDIFVLDNECQHVINPGAIFNGMFATIDTNYHGEKFPVLKYHWI
jgi:hypothetical protein